jgi:outer membrane protein assembly factor BamD (BamD/ComL family)
MNAIEIKMALDKMYQSGYDKGLSDAAEMVNRILQSNEADNRRD